MIPEQFEYFAPQTVEEAINLLQEHGDEGRVLAGGLSLIPMMKLRLASPTYLVDINGIQDLSYIRRESETILIGALARHRDIHESEDINEMVPLLAETAEVIGDPQVRNRGTMGGSLAHADPASDYGAALLTLEVEVRIAGPDGERVVSIEDLFVDMYTTALESGELVTEVVIPIPKGRTGSSYKKFERVAGDFATAGVASLLTLDEEDNCQKARIGLTAVSLKPMRAREAEKELEGRVIDDSSIGRAAEKAMEASDPLPDLRGSVEYKRKMTGTLVSRGLSQALARARGGA